MGVVKFSALCLFAGGLVVRCIQGDQCVHLPVEEEGRCHEVASDSQAVFLQVMVKHERNEKKGMVDEEANAKAGLGKKGIKEDNNDRMEEDGSRNDSSPRKVTPPQTRCPSLWDGFVFVFKLLAPLGIAIICTILCSCACVCLQSLAPEELANQKGIDIVSEESSQPLPAVLWYFIMLGQVLLSVNFTVVMPRSHEVTQRADEHNSMTWSGALIGVYAMGSITSTPLMLYFSKVSYKSAIVLMGVAGVIGNSMYALASSGWSADILSARSMLMIARFICGLEGSIIVVFQIILLRCSSQGQRVRNFSHFATSSSVGLLLGPLFSSMCQTIMYSHRVEAPSILMSCCAGVYGLAAMCLFPGQDKCFELAEVPCPSEVMVQPRKYSPWLVVVAQMHLCLQCMMQGVRHFQRVVWETAALTIIDQEYGYGSTVAGWLVPCAVLGLALLPVTSSYLHQCLGMNGFTALAEVLELIGLLLMIRMGPPTQLSLVLFMIGSCAFYLGNWAQSVPYNALRPDFDLPNHPWLSLEASCGIQWLCMYIFYFAGPILIRTILSRCLSQNMAPFVLSFGLVSFALPARLAVNILLSRRKAFMDLVKVTSNRK